MDDIRITYIEEANELLASLETALLALETNAGDSLTIEEVFRVMHTLKGNSSMFGLSVIVEFVHDLETIYDQVRTGEMLLSRELLDCTFQCLDHLKNIVRDAELSDEANQQAHKQLIARISTFIGVPALRAGEVPEPEARKATWHIFFAPGTDVFSNGTNPLFLLDELAAMGRSRVIPHFKKTESFSDYQADACITYWDIFLETEKTINDLRDVFLFVEDTSVVEMTMLAGSGHLDDYEFIRHISSARFTDARVDLSGVAMPEAAQHHEEAAVPVAGQASVSVKTENRENAVSSIRVNTDKLDELMNLVSELVTTQAGLTLYTSNNKSIELETISENIEKLTRRLRDVAFGMTLVPINNLFGRFQRMVRDVSAVLGKEVEFVTEGGETELDKNIIETLTDPLMHILRNSLDHGIEKPEDRLRAGKPRQGRLVLKAYYSGVFVYIRISDDGKGIDVNAVREKAISKGLIHENDVLTDKQVFDIIFHPGFSTAQKVTDVSGRGVGMDVVKRNITDIKGAILVDSSYGSGTTLTIRLPLTLSIIDGLLVAVSDEHYIIPLSVITKCYEVYNHEMLGNFNRLLVLDGEQVPFIHMRDEFGESSDPALRSQLIVVNTGERKVGISVDHIVGEYQAVVKPLGKFYKKQDFVSGASILGDGTIALVLDAAKLIELYTNNLKTEEQTWL